MKRVIIVAASQNEQALLAAELSARGDYVVESAETVEEALARLILRADLVLVDWSNLEMAPDSWTKLRTALRGARLLVLASQVDRARVRAAGIDPESVLFRPLTVGQAVTSACALLERGPTDV